MCLSDLNPTQKQQTRQADVTQWVTLIQRHCPSVTTLQVSTGMNFIYLGEGGKKDCTLTLENTKPLPTSFLKVGAKGMSLLYVAFVNHLSVNWQLSAIPGWISNLGVNPGSFDDHHDWPSVVHSWYEFTQRLVKINEVPEVREFHLFRQASPLLRPILPGLW